MIRVKITPHITSVTTKTVVSDMPLLLADVKFTDRTECSDATEIIPFVRPTTRKIYACLALSRIIRLS